MLRKEEEEEEKYEENKTNFEDAYFGNGLADFETEGAPPRGNSYRKFCVFLFREC